MGHPRQPRRAQGHRPAALDPGLDGEADAGRARPPRGHPHRRGPQAVRDPHRRGREAERRSCAPRARPRPASSRPRARPTPSRRSSTRSTAASRPRSCSPTSTSRCCRRSPAATPTRCGSSRRELTDALKGIGGALGGGQRGFDEAATTTSGSTRVTDDRRLRGAVLEDPAKALAEARGQAGQASTEADGARRPGVPGAATGRTARGCRAPAPREPHSAARRTHAPAGRTPPPPPPPPPAAPPVDDTAARSPRPAAALTTRSRRHPVTLCRVTGCRARRRSPSRWPAPGPA